jgi:AcrR family transcriptional regulator
VAKTFRSAIDDEPSPRAGAASTLRARQAEATRQLLVSVARDLFTEHGYAGTSVADIIQGAGVTRGALYHHFAGKEALFRAVHDAVQADAMSRVVTARLAVQEPWAAVRAGLSAYLDACLEPAFRRIVMLGAVSAPPGDVTEGGVEHAEHAVLRAVLAPLAVTDLTDVSVEALVHVAHGALYSAALYIARCPDPRAARTDADAVLDALTCTLHSSVEAPPRAQTTAAMLQVSVRQNV